MSPSASSQRRALELARAADALERMEHTVGVVLDPGHRDPLGTRITRESGCSRSGPKLRQAAILDRRDHPAQRLADPAEGDALLDRHRAPSLPAKRGPASVTRGTLSVGRDGRA